MFLGLPVQRESGTAGNLAFHSHSLKAIKAEEEKEKAAEEVKKEKIAKQIEESSKYYNTNAKPGSLASKAAMVQKYNEAHDKRK